MDGGSVHCPSNLRVRFKVALLDPDKSPARMPVHCTIGEYLPVEPSLVGDKLWLTVRGESAGLPVEPDIRRANDTYSWRYLWEEELVEIEKQVNGEWRPLTKGKYPHPSPPNRPPSIAVC